MSSVLLSGPPATGPAQIAVPPTPPAPPAPPGLPGAEPAGQRSQTLLVIAGVGVLMLAMGVGVLIGRSSAPRPSTPAPQVITLAGGGGSASSGTPAEASFTSDWPSGTTKGYTVQLQTLPESGTSVSAVEAAKTAATGKGAKSVGALKSEEFASLTSGNYVIYSGVYHTRAQAQKALSGVKQSFPSASVVEVSNRSSGSPSSSSSAAGPAGSGTAGSSINHPAPPSVLEGLKSARGKSYEEKSKNLPNVVED
jgi:hypothetical protein